MNSQTAYGADNKLCQPPQISWAYHVNIVKVLEQRLRDRPTEPEQPLSERRGAAAITLRRLRPRAAPLGQEQRPATAAVARDATLLRSLEMINVL